MSTESVNVSRREYAERVARTQYPHAHESRDLLARLLDRELSRTYSPNGRKKE